LGGVGAKLVEGVEVNLGHNIITLKHCMVNLILELIVDSVKLL